MPLHPLEILPVYQVPQAKQFQRRYWRQWIDMECEVIERLVDLGLRGLFVIGLIAGGIFIGMGIKR